MIGGKPGAAGPPSPFEYWYLAEPAYRAGDYERAYEIAAEGLEHYPDNPACTTTSPATRRSPARREDALRAPRRRVRAAGRRSREWAADDSDLDSIRVELGL